MKSNRKSVNLIAMRVAMISRSTLFSSAGGDTVQIVSTARALQALGVEAEVKLCTERIDYERYDLLHFFNIIRPADILGHIVPPSPKVGFNSPKSPSGVWGPPYLVSTIFVDYSAYEKNAREGLRGMLLGLLGPDLAEYMKVIMRRILNGEKINNLSYLLKGHRGSVKYVIKRAAMLLPNSESEYKRLWAAYKEAKEYRVVPNAIDEKIFKLSDEPKDSSLILCVSRIEGRKNQLNLIRALNGTGYQLHIIGSHSPNHKKYYEQCKKEAMENVHFTDWMDHEALAALYVRARVHVLPSWFETTGLSSLEAAASGCNIVITDYGDTREYFGDEAFYCEPDDVLSIRHAVERAASAPVNQQFAEKISNEYTWSRAAAATLAAYQEVLNRQG